MKAQEFRKLIREEVRKVVREASTTKVMPFAKVKPGDIAYMDADPSQEITILAKFTGREYDAKGKKYDTDGELAGLQRMVNSNFNPSGLTLSQFNKKEFVAARGSGKTIIFQYGTAGVYVPTDKNLVGTSGSGAKNIYEKAALEIFKYQKDTLEDFGLDLFMPNYFKPGNKEIKTQSDLVKWYNNMIKELTDDEGYSSDEEAIKDIIKTSPQIAKKVGVELK